uniref:Uncharacterized protein n=1 Tax=Amphimedon queenslandica TaxID=400682 RepID=A0A1X7VSW7_AMPQE
NGKLISTLPKLKICSDASFTGCNFTLAEMFGQKFDTHAVHIPGVQNSFANVLSSKGVEFTD